MTGQLAFALPVRAAVGRDRFLVADCNGVAVGWIDRWPDWPAPALLLHGPAGCGKSHLAAVWRERTAAGLVDAADLAGVAAGAGGVPLAVEDIERRPDDRSLLHLYNHVAETGGSLLLTARRPAADLGVALPDLASRLRALPACGIEAPDDALLAAVVRKQFADRQVMVADDVISYLLARIERSFAAAAGAVDALDRAGLSRGRRITVALARDVLERRQN